MRFIGDVHGKWKHYKRIINDVDDSIQVGDLGVGFYAKRGPKVGQITDNPPHYAMVRGNHRFIRGNHDNPHACTKHSQWIKDGYYDDVNDMFFVGGALSIDKALRTENWDWWSDEELSINDLYNVMDNCLLTKPSIMITHDCPDVVSDILFLQHRFKIKSRTSQALSSIFNAWQPKLWIHGHWHIDSDTIINGTRFICLGELSYIDIDLNDPVNSGKIVPKSRV